jgi:hypothetical protein
MSPTSYQAAPPRILILRHLLHFRNLVTRYTRYSQITTQNFCASLFKLLQVFGQNVCVDIKRC